MEMDMNLISKDLDRFKTELLYNIRMKRVIEDNMGFLKNTKAAISLMEYRKIKQQYKLVETRIKLYEGKIRPLEQALNMKVNNYQEEMKRFEEMYKLQFKNNILEFPNERRKKA
jgi:lantibiotic modifying enzyme